MCTEAADGKVLPRGLSIALAPAVAAVLLVACGQAKLDTDRAESAIRAQITRQTGVKIESMRCPDEVEARRGETFRCLVVASSGERSTVEVTQRDAEGGLSWRLVPPRGGG